MASIATLSVAAAALTGCTPKQEVDTPKPTEHILTIDQELHALKPASLINPKHGEAPTMDAYLEDRDKAAFEAMNQLGKNADALLTTLKLEYVNIKRKTDDPDYGPEKFTYATKPREMGGFLIKTEEYEPSINRPPENYPGSLDSYYELVTIGKAGEPAVTLRLQKDGSTSTTITYPIKGTNKWGNGGKYIGTVSPDQDFGKGIVHSEKDPSKAVMMRTRPSHLPTVRSERPLSTP